MRQTFWCSLLVMMTSILLGQADWLHSANNPVLKVGSFGAWDGVSIFAPDVLFYDGQYHMWYTGSNGSLYKIGHATSDDGFQWERDANNPILTAQGGSWQGVNLNVPRVTQVGSTFHMWFYTADKVGHASSPNGIDWTFTNDPVLQGTPGSWDAATCAAAEIIHDGSIFHMWYTGVDANGKWAVGYATSTDGVNWTKYGNNPVLSPGGFGTWDGAMFYATSVVSDGQEYNLWYSAKSGDVGYNQTGRATSSNGVDWIKQSVNGPEISRGNAGTWNDAASFYASAILHNDRYEIWYNGASTADLAKYQIGYAWEPDTTSIKDQREVFPESIVLNQNYPNPFNPITNISYELPENTLVKLAVFDVLGQEIVALKHDVQPAGDYQVIWNGTNGLGEQVATGLYFARLTAGRHSDVIKMLLLR